MEVDPSARKHGVADDDMRHAVRQPMKLVRQDERRVLVIGASRNGRLLEVVVLQDPEEEPVIIHADLLRPKFYRYLR